MGGQQTQQGQQSPYGDRRSTIRRSPQTHQQYGDWGARGVSTDTAAAAPAVRQQQPPQYDQQQRSTTSSSPRSTTSMQQPSTTSSSTPLSSNSRSTTQNGWPTGSYPQDPYAGRPDGPVRAAAGT
ncbi:hypothetical protein GCM10023238_27560 [Streptomyces heliomycini]